MATWVSNPVTKPLLDDSLGIDDRVREAYNAANPGTLQPTQAVVSSNQVIDTADGGTVTLTVAGNAVTNAVYAAGV